MYKRLAIVAAIAGVGLCIGNAIATVFYWYTSWWWFDMVMHTLGGMFTAFVCSLVFFKTLRNRSSKQYFITIMLAVFIVGLAWEYYEYIVQFYIKAVHLADITDSISDLICDMFGGGVAVGFVILLRTRYNQR